MSAEREGKSNGRSMTRRALMAAGLASAAGVVGYRLPGDLPPTFGHPLRVGDALTYAAQRALLPAQSLVREYTLADLTSFPAVGTIDPLKHKDPAVVEAYSDIRADDFADWRLQVEGQVATPREFALADLKRFPARTQITRHTCEEGWTAIGQWTGVPLRLVLEAAGILPTARFVVFYTLDDLGDSLDMLDALHPQTILAYAMNGQQLPVRHGAPLRLRVERQMGYKSLKYLTRIVVTDQFDDAGPKGDIQNGWSWYVGI